MFFPKVSHDLVAVWISGEGFFVQGNKRVLLFIDRDVIDVCFFEILK